MEHTSNLSDQFNMIANEPNYHTIVANDDDITINEANNMDMMELFKEEPQPSIKELIATIQELKDQLTQRDAEIDELRQANLCLEMGLNTIIEEEEKKEHSKEGVDLQTRNTIQRIKKKLREIQELHVKQKLGIELKQKEIAALFDKESLDLQLQTLLNEPLHKDESFQKQEMKRMYTTNKTLSKEWSHARQSINVLKLKLDELTRHSVEYSVYAEQIQEKNDRINLFQKQINELQNAYEYRYGQYQQLKQRLNQEKCCNIACQQKLDDYKRLIDSQDDMIEKLKSNCLKKLQNDEKMLNKKDYKTRRMMKRIQKKLQWIKKMEFRMRQGIQIDSQPIAKMNLKKELLVKLELLRNGTLNEKYFESESEALIELAVGDRVGLECGNCGVIKFIGKTVFSPKKIIGIELDEWSPNGHNGAYKKIQYFDAVDGHGLFVGFHEIISKLGDRKSNPSVSNVRKGDRIRLKNGLVGEVMHKGKVDFADGEYLGIALQTAYWNCNNGAINGRRYFNVKKRRGYFAKKADVVDILGSRKQSRQSQLFPVIEGCIVHENINVDKEHDKQSHTT